MKMHRNLLLRLLPGVLLLFGGGAVRAQQQLVETEPIEPFNALRIEGPVRVELIPADENQMQMMTWSLEAKALTWRVRENTLHIAARKGLLNKRAYADIKLYYKELNRIQMSGGEVYTREPIRCGSLYLEAESSVGRMTLQTECNDVTIHASGDNTVRIGGIAEYATYRARLGSRIEALDLSAMEAAADASGKGEIQLRVNETLDARAVSGGNIFFLGEPMTLNIRKATLGNVTSINEP